MSEPDGQLILLVDDETHLLITLRDALTFSGYRVEMARSAEEALRKLKRIKPDLIILDISMPGMGGLGFLREAMNEDSVVKAPVLVLTARANLRDFFGNVDVAGFVSKPCSKQELLDKVQSILGQAEVREAQPRSETLKILLGEDDAAMASVIRRTFERHGHEVTVVDSGPRVLDSAVAVQPDVVVMAEVLTRMNGSAVASLLRSMPRTRELPVVLYTPERGSFAVRQDTNSALQDVDERVATTDSMHILAAVLRQVEARAPGGSVAADA